MGVPTVLTLRSSLCMNQLWARARKIEGELEVSTIVVQQDVPFLRLSLYCILMTSEIS